MVPPRIEITPKVRHRFRFACPSGSVLSNVTVLELLGVCGGICTAANTTFKPWAGSVRIHSVRIYNGLSSTGYTLANLTWNVAADSYVPDEEWNQTFPEGTTTPGCLTFRPPKKSLASFWLSGASGAVFSISASAGSVVDVDLSFRLSNQFTASTIPIATGTLGTIYYMCLDGNTTHNFAPIGLPFTF